MKIKNYITKNKIKKTDAAKQLETSFVNIFRWINGVSIPRPAEMKKIFIWSNGEVSPNDFYDIDSTKTDKSQQKTNFKEGEKGEC